MICDPRIITKHYGKRIWQSLPPFKRTREEAEAVAFFQDTAEIQFQSMSAAFGSESGNLVA
jgi:Rad3-related DNA helicase